MILEWRPFYATRDAFLPGRAIALLGLHIAAGLAPFWFRADSLVLFLVLSFLTGHLGISFAFHRMLSHRSFQPHVAIHFLSALLGTLAAQAGPVTWVAIHRLHHRQTDLPNDPHTPRHSIFWAHLAWMAFRHPELTPKRVGELAKDAWRDPVLSALERHRFAIVALSLVTLFAAGFIVAGLNAGISYVLWGGCARIVFVWHSTFLLNSVCHLHGYRNYDTKDDSRNSWLAALLVLGEGWHNNHHAFPSAACTGHRPWEVDPIYCLIKILCGLKLCMKVVPVPSSVSKHENAAPAPPREQQPVTRHV
jgi:stearoyl-CoA desaturase (delta-9 desaturase)